MRGLCGWFSNGQSIADGEQLLARMIDGYRGTAASPESKSFEQAGFAVFGKVARPVLIEADGLVMAIAGHPRTHDDAGSAIDLRVLARRIRESGKAALATVAGDFALAIWDRERRCGLLAVDRMGVHPLMYADLGDSLVFGSTLDMLFGHAAVPRRLSTQSLFDYLYYHVCPGPETIYQGLMRVPPGHCVEFDSSGAKKPVAYWTMRFEPQVGISVEDRKKEFVSLVQKSVNSAADTSGCGTFLSGGTDSSTVSGMLRRAAGKPVPTFSIGFDAPGYDETEYARIAAKHFGTDHHEYYVTPADVVEAVPRIAASYDQPFGNASAIPTYYCAHFAQQHGIERLLAGDGGDELFGGNSRYATQHLLSFYGHVPGALRRGLIEPLLLSTPGLSKVPLIRKLRSYVEQAKPPMPQRYESYNLLQHLGFSQVFTPDFLAAVNVEHPLALLADAYAPFADASLINQMLAIDFRFILADGDLPKVSHMCNLAEVDVAFPLLDDRIVEFSGRLPDDLKLRGTQLRWFFKHALNDFLPTEIIHKKKHGFGLPVGHWLVSHKPLFDMASASIESLAPRGIVDRKFARHLLDVKLHEHPPYYGGMVWVLMMLGLWLESRKL